MLGHGGHKLHYGCGSAKQGMNGESAPKLLPAGGGSEFAETDIDRRDGDQLELT